MDAIVLSDGGLGAILGVMKSHAGERMVQWTACVALLYITLAASPPALIALRESAAVELLNAAKSNHVDDDDVVILADNALEALVGEGEGEDED